MTEIDQKVAINERPNVRVRVRSWDVVDIPVSCQWGEYARM